MKVKGNPMINDYSMLKEGDEVTFMITGAIYQYRGVILKPKGYQNRPELKVTHHRSGIKEEWMPDSSWNGMILKGDDFVLIDKL